MGMYLFREPDGILHNGHCSVSRSIPKTDGASILEYLVARLITLFFYKNCRHQLLSAHPEA